VSTSQARILPLHCRNDFLEKKEILKALISDMMKFKLIYLFLYNDDVSNPERNMSAQCSTPNLSSEDAWAKS
jgi:hypothetical protein